jgi:hypothetical protein
MRIAVVFALLEALSAAGYQPDEVSTPSILVLVFDNAGLSEDILNRGLAEAERVLKSGGVEVVWVRCAVTPQLLALVKPCRDAPGPLALVLHILPHEETSQQTDPDLAGFALSAADGGFGASAGVFYDRVKQLGMKVTEPVGLGHVIAHELGHLLLGAGYHSVAGIMIGSWSSRQVILAAQGVLQFQPGERLRILGNLRRRMLAAGGAATGK